MELDCPGVPSISSIEGGGERSSLLDLLADPGMGLELEGVPPAWRSILPRSEPYAGGGASVPTLGARPHFFTFASMKTNPI